MNGRSTRKSYISTRSLAISMMVPENVLLSLLSVETSCSKLLRSLAPDGKLDAEGVMYDSLVELLKSHFKNKQPVVIHRFNFNTRLWKPCESIADYIAALRELAMNCNFGSKEEMLRDRLMCGVNHSGIQRKLLCKGDVSYKDALALAQSIEAAEDDAQKLVGSTTPVQQPVNFTLQKSNSPSPPCSVLCYRCGGPHLAPVCPHNNKVCRYCKKEGHLAKVCHAKLRNAGKTNPSSSSATTSSTTLKLIRSHLNRQRTPTTYKKSLSWRFAPSSLIVIHSEHSPPFTTTLYTNDIPVLFKVDTGAAVTVLNEATFRTARFFWCDIPLQPATSTLKTYTGHDIAVIGVAQLTMR